MFKFYQHKEKNNILYVYYYDIVTVTDAEKLITIYSRLFPKITEKIIILQEFTAKGSLKDKQFLTVLAKHTNDNSFRFQLSVLIGLQGIYKVLYYMYTTLAPVEIKRVLIDKKEEAIELYNITIPNDFNLIYSYPKEDK